MFITSDTATLRAKLQEWRTSGERIGFVPTMGNLHTGHMALTHRARADCDKVVASIFVNPAQFGENEDLSSYPHTPEKDQQLLRPVCNLLFCPTSQTIYPGGTCLTSIDIPPFTSQLCGEHRPRHFVGVLTVVNLLFQLVQPDTAYFGLKDYQQYWLIRRMVADLHCPVTITGVDTGRDTDGLALSSRNQYLDAQQRALAPLLYQSLRQAATQLAKLDPAGKLEAHHNISSAAIDTLGQKGFRVDYFTLRDSDTLYPPDENTRNYRLLAAAWLGKARLIDNIAL